MIATDGSEASEKAADFGIEMVGCRGAKVYAVYIIDTTSYGSVSMDKRWSKAVFEQFEEIGHAVISYVEEKAKIAGMEAESIVLKGNPAEEIVGLQKSKKLT